MRRKILVRSLIAAGIFSAATMGGYIAQSSSVFHSAVAAGTLAPVAATNVQPGARVAVPDFTTIVEQNGVGGIDVDKHLALDVEVLE